MEMNNLGWVDWSTITAPPTRSDHIAPAEAEANCCAAIENSIWTHDTNETASGKPGALQRLDVMDFDWSGIEPLLRTKVPGVPRADA